MPDTNRLSWNELCNTEKHLGAVLGSLVHVIHLAGPGVAQDELVEAYSALLDARAVLSKEILRGQQDDAK